MIGNSITVSEIAPRQVPAVRLWSNPAPDSSATLDARQSDAVDRPTAGSVLRFAAALIATVSGHRSLHERSRGIGLEFLASALFRGGARDFWAGLHHDYGGWQSCLLYTSPSPRDGLLSRMP